VNEENAAHAYAGYDAARAGVAVGSRAPRGWVRLWDADAVSFLHGILTNDIASLAPGAWRYAAYLTPQGRMISDMRVLRRADDVVLETEPHVAETLARRFDASIFTERVRIGVGFPWIDGADDSTERPDAETIVVCGPAAPGMLASVLGDDAGLPLAPYEFAELAREEGRMVLVRHDDLGTPAVDVAGPPDACAQLGHDLQEAGATPLGPLALEALRIEAGTPRFGTDMTEDTIPLEAGIEGRAISFTKGCYVGQEVIIRILHRGHGRVARRLVGLSIDGQSVPASGSPLGAGGRDVGLITSAVFSPRLGRPIALGYVHRDVSAAGTAVAVQPAGTPAIVTDLPFMKRCVPDSPGSPSAA
jgi:tRNA-modifying protein YgfZ